MICRCAVYTSPGDL